MKRIACHTTETEVVWKKSICMEVHRRPLSSPYRGSTCRWVLQCDAIAIPVSSNKRPLCDACAVATHPQMHLPCMVLPKVVLPRLPDDLSAIEAYTSVKACSDRVDWGRNLSAGYSRPQFLTESSFVLIIRDCTSGRLLVPRHNPPSLSPTLLPWFFWPNRLAFSTSCAKMTSALISILGLVRSITPHMNESVVRSYRTDRLEFFFVRKIPLTVERVNDLFMGGACWVIKYRGRTWFVRTTRQCSRTGNGVFLKLICMYLQVVDQTLCLSLYFRISCSCHHIFSSARTRHIVTILLFILSFDSFTKRNLIHTTHILTS